MWDEVLSRLFAGGVGAATAGVDAEARFAHAEEAALVARAVPSRRREFATGRRLAHELLAASGVPDGPLGRRPDRAPDWPAGTVGSIAHAAGRVAVVVGDAVRWESLGLDLEPDEPLEPSLWRSILRPEELALCADLAARDPEAAGRWARSVFCVKEVVYKLLAARVGKVFGFHAARVSNAGSVPTEGAVPAGGVVPTGGGDAARGTVPAEGAGLTEGAGPGVAAASAGARAAGAGHPAVPARGAARPARHDRLHVAIVEDLPGVPPDTRFEVAVRRHEGLIIAAGALPRSGT